MIRWVRAALLRALVFAGLWWLLTEGSGAWSYGLPIVTVLTVVTLWLSAPVTTPRRPLPVRTRAALHVVGWFLGHSVRGAVDVARRALARPVDVDPVDETFPVQLTSPLGRVLLTDFATLTPGTLSVDLTETPDGHVLHLHILHRDIDAHRALSELQDHLADLLDPPQTDRKEL